MVYDEFDDCTWNGACCSSTKALAAMRNLAKEHGLGFVFNPGGGEYTRKDTGWRCQITTCDDVMDLNTLREAVSKL